MDPLLSDPPAQLSAAVIREAVEKLRTYRPQPHMHLVHPKHWTNGGWGTCADCMEPVYLDPHPRGADGTTPY